MTELVSENEVVDDKIIESNGVKFKSFRSKITYECELPLVKRVCIAGADYSFALQNESFAKYYGGVKALHDDLITFIELWHIEVNNVGM